MKSGTNFGTVPYDGIFTPTVGVKMLAYGTARFPLRLQETEFFRSADLHGKPPAWAHV